MTVRVKRVRVSVSVYFAALVTFACAFAPNGSAPLGLLCCLAHESGHLLPICLTGERVSAVSFGICGARIVPARQKLLSHRQEAWIAAGGPAVNLLLCAAGFLLKYPRLVSVNAALAAFNLMPAHGTDGWQVLYHLLAQTLTPEKLRAALKTVSAVFLALMYVFGVLLMRRSGYNFTVLACAAYLTVLFLRRGGKTEPAL